MSLFDKLFKKSEQLTNTNTVESGSGTAKPENRPILNYFQTLNGYTPAFTSFNGGLYEVEQTRAAIHAVASAFSKLTPEVTGELGKEYEHILKYRPNAWMDTTKFLYRVATSLLVNNTAFIVPLFDERDGKTIRGFFPAVPELCELKEDTRTDKVFLTYTFLSGQRAAVEFERCGILTRHQYKNDIFGESNKAMGPTLRLIKAHEESIELGVKQGANIRFMAKLASALKESDITAEKSRFVNNNLSNANAGGVIMFDSKYDDVKQLSNGAFIVDPEQAALINQNVYSYFGVNKFILQNSWETSNVWAAFYEGAIEPLAIQLSNVISNMLFDEHALRQGNSIYFTTNRVQYATIPEKISFVTQLFDREMLTINEAREVFNLAPVEDGDKRLRRGEYKESGEDAVGPTATPIVEGGATNVDGKT